MWTLDKKQGLVLTGELPEAAGLPIGFADRGAGSRFGGVKMARDDDEDEADLDDDEEDELDDFDDDDDLDEDDDFDDDDDEDDFGDDEE